MTSYGKGTWDEQDHGFLITCIFSLQENVSIRQP